jgi:hypothetical protein
MCHSDSMCLFLTRLRYASPRYANKLPVKKTTIFNPNNTIYYLHIFCVVLDNFLVLLFFLTLYQWRTQLLSLNFGISALMQRYSAKLN